MSDHFDHDRDLNEKQLLHKIVGLLQQLINITISGDEAIIAALNPQPKLNDELVLTIDRKSTRLNSSHLVISYAAFCLITSPLDAVQCNAGGAGTQLGAAVADQQSD